MTVATTTNKAIGTGNGVTTSFPFTFGTLPSGDLVVTLIDLDGNEIEQDEIADYTVTGKGEEDGGAVVFVAPPTSGYTVLIQRILPYVQPTDYKNQGSFYPRTHERSFDRATMLAQQLAESDGRTIKIPAHVQGVSTTMPTPAGATFWGWNEAGTAPKLYTLGDIATTAAFQSWRFETFAGDGNETEFSLAVDPGNIANLDVSIDGVTQVPGTDYGLLGTEVSFSSAPELGAVILIRYGQAVPELASSAMQWVETPVSAGQSVIAFPGAASYGQIVALSLNGILQHPSAYSANGAAVTLTEAMPEGGSAAALVSAIPANNISAGNIGVTADIPGAPTRTLQEKSRDVVSLRDAGAVGDGVANDAAAITAALATGKIIDGGGLTYKVNSAIALSTTTRLRNAVIDFSGAAASTTCLSPSGSLGASTGVTGSVAKGANSFTLSGALSLVPGDLLVLTSADHWSDQGTPVIKAEWVRVKTLVGSVVTIEGETQDSYSTTVVVYKPALVAVVELDNVHFIGAGDGQNQKAVTSTLVDVVRYRDCSVRNFATWGFATDRCRDAKAINITGHNADESTNLAYLVDFAGFTQSAQASQISAHGFRHAVTAGGTTGVVRSYQVSDVCGVSMEEATVDAHPSVEVAQFSNIRHNGTGTATTDGIVSQALHTFIDDVDIDTTGRFGVLIQPQCVGYAPSARVSRVRANNCGDYAVSVDLQYARVKASMISLEAIGLADGGFRGINISTGASSLGASYLRIVGCRLDTTDRCVSGSISVAIDSVEITGGYMRRANNTAEVVLFNGASPGLLPFVRASNLETVGGNTGLRVINPTKAIVMGNRFSGWTSAATTGLTHDGTNIINANNVAV